MAGSNLFKMNEIKPTAPLATGLRCSKQGDILFVCLDNPPVNAITLGVRAAFGLALDAAESDAEITGLVICAAGKLFSGGGDMREIGKQPLPGAPTLGELVVRIERFAKPVVVAMQGRAIGGGVLLSLACHGRIATPAASIALPEVNLGFVPGAGGTQRLPRLVGLKAALQMIALAESLDAEKAWAAGFFDAVVTAEALQETAAALARDIAAGRQAWRRTADLSVPGHADGEAVRRHFMAQAAIHLPGRAAPREAIDLVLAAAETDFDAGFLREKAAYDRLAPHRETQALLHLFFASRAATASETAVGITEAGEGSITLQRPVDRPRSRLVELVMHGEVSLASLRAALVEARQQRLMPVLVRGQSIAERLQTAYQTAIAQMQMQGHTAQAIAAAALAEGFAITQVDLSPQENLAIASELLRTVVTEAQACLADGLAERPGDIDVIAVEACGFPERYGGPLFYDSTWGSRA